MKSPVRTKAVLALAQLYRPLQYFAQDGENVRAIGDEHLWHGRNVEY
jgi:hypothetical protein